MMSNNRAGVATWSTLEDRRPAYALVANVDLVVIRHDDQVSVFYGRCLHRGALLSDAAVKGDDLVCGLHGWDYRYDTGVSSYSLPHQQLSSGYCNSEKVPQGAAGCKAVGTATAKLSGEHGGTDEDPGTCLRTQPLQGLLEG